MYAESPAKPTLINYLSYSDRKIKGRRRHYTVYFDELLFIVQGGDAAAHSPNKTNASDSYNRRKYRVLSDTPEEEFLPQQLQRQCLFALCSTHHGNGNMVFRCWGRAVNCRRSFCRLQSPSRVLPSWHGLSTRVPFIGQHLWSLVTVNSFGNGGFTAGHVKARENWAIPPPLFPK